MTRFRNFYLTALALALFVSHCAKASAEYDLSEQVTQLVEDHTQFAFSLYPELDTESANLVFSPYSVSSCLSMAYLGARDETEAQMQQALNLDFNAKEIAAPYAELNQLLLPAPSKKSYDLTLANALWLDDKSYILADYRFALEKQFGAKITNLSFAQPDSALATINKWVETKTNGHIRNLLTRSDISAATRLILTNAAYFKGSFMRPFDVQMTHEAEFYPTTGTAQMVKMMEQTGYFSYVENDLFQALALPFHGSSQGKGQLALVVVLPKSPENFDPLMKMMPDAFEEALQDLQGQKVHVQLPKFMLSKRYPLNEALQQLGMKNPFTTQANFSGIDGRMNLYINQVVHETYFSLDENGVTAAAATGASMNITSAPTTPAEFKADHPFLFFIVDLKSTEVLFIGKFADATDVI
jgi:serpin B